MARTLHQLLTLGAWLQDLSGLVEAPVLGVAASQDELAFATREEGWRVPLNKEQMPYIQAGLSRLLTSRSAPSLAVYDTASFLQACHLWLGETYDQEALLNHINIDRKALSHSTGYPVRAGDNPLQEAMDCAIFGPELLLDASRFYKQVGLPVAKHKARPLFVPPNDDATWHRWVVTYDWLLLRVLAHFTHDPTMTRWLQDKQQAITLFAKTVGLDPRSAVAFLLWLICGEDTEVFLKQHPGLAGDLPTSPALVRATHVDTHLPALRLGLLSLMEECQERRTVHTLYGRTSPVGLSASERLHWMILGTVYDLLDVLVVSLCNAGNRTHRLVLSEGHFPWQRVKIIGYTQEEVSQWQQDLEQLSQLADPLGIVPLAPTVWVE